MGIGAEPLLGLRDTDHVEQLENALARGARAQALVHEQHLADLLFHHVQRIQRHHGLLEDHRDLIAAHGAQADLGGADELLALETDRAARGVARNRVGQQLQNG